MTFLNPSIGSGAPDSFYELLMDADELEVKVEKEEIDLDDPADVMEVVLETEEEEAMERMPVLVCGRIFTNSSSYYSHMKAHSPPRFACEHCDYKTPHKCDLVKHLRVHTGEKLYQCETCSSCFRVSSSLTDHIRRLHTGERRFKCTMCDKGFCNRTKLNLHIDAHNNIKRYECEICHSCFARRCYWKKHLDTRHGVVVPAQRPGRRRMDLQIGEFTPGNGTVARLLDKQSLDTEK